jgi:hypothetical protein
VYIFMTRGPPTLTQGTCQNEAPVAKDESLQTTRPIGQTFHGAYHMSSILRRTFFHILQFLKSGVRFIFNGVLRIDVEACRMGLGRLEGDGRKISETVV